MGVETANDEKQAEQTQTGKSSKVKKKELSQTIKNLKLTRTPMSKTLTSIRDHQEAGQTALKKQDQRTATAKFRIEALKEHGKGSLAYSSLQPGMSYFMREGLGYIAYKQLPDSPNSICVLADPICAPDKTRELLDELLKEKNDPVFIHINHDTAKIVNELGFCVNELGVETFIDLQEFTLVGNKKQQLRQARNNARKDNIKVHELTSVNDPLFIHFKRISDAWMKEKVVSDNDLQFVVRPIIYVDELDVRKFVAVREGEIVGFVIFDPMYQGGEAIGYIANHLRSNIERNYSVVDYIILEAMEKFKAEGKKEVSLGLSPMARIDDTDEFKHSKLLKAHFQFAFEKANFLYNFKNLHRHKSKYRPELPGCREEKVYCGMKTRFLLIRMLSVYNVLGLDPVKQTVQHVRHVVGDWFKSHLLIGHKPEQKEVVADKGKNAEH